MEVGELRPRLKEFISKFKQNKRIEGSSSAPLYYDAACTALVSLKRDIVYLRDVDDTEEDLLFGLGEVRTIKNDRKRTAIYEGNAQQGKIESLALSLKPGDATGEFQLTEFTPTTVDHLQVILDASGEPKEAAAIHIDRKNLLNSECEEYQFSPLAKPNYSSSGV